jgi:hypothetical protein
VIFWNFFNIILTYAWVLQSKWRKMGFLEVGENGRDL